MSRKYLTMRDGELTVLSYRRASKTNGAVVKVACCDCGLTHTFVFIPMKTRAHFYVYRDKRATANIRRRKDLPFMPKGE